MQAKDIVSFDVHCDVLTQVASLSYGTILVPIRAKGSRGSFEIELPTLTVPKTIVPEFKKQNGQPTEVINTNVFSFLNLQNENEETKEIFAKIDKLENDALRALFANRASLPTDCSIKQKNVEVFVESAKHLIRRESSSYPPSIGVKFNVKPNGPMLQDAMIDVHLDVDEPGENGKIVRTMYKETPSIQQGWKIQPVLRLGYIWISSLGGCGFGWFVSHFKLLNPVEVQTAIQYSNDKGQNIVAVSKGAFTLSAHASSPPKSLPSPPFLNLDGAEYDANLDEPALKRARLD